MEPEKRCKKGTRKYKPLGEGCHRNEDIEKHTKNTLPSGLELPSVLEPIELHSTAKKRCPKKTRKFKLLGDECYTNQQIENYEKQNNPHLEDNKEIIEKEGEEGEKEGEKGEKEVEEEGEEVEHGDVVEEEYEDDEFIEEETGKVEYYKNLENPDSEIDFLYPALEDPYFNKQLSLRKEFESLIYDGEIKPDIKKISNLICENPEFELLPHQLFVKNFLSKQTPYNSILLYHGLGSGKTCSAIGIAEEMRDYMKQTGISQRILIIASTNVQDNFRLQLFDERKLVENKDKSWSINTCVGTKILNEINPTNSLIERDKIISQAKTTINASYAFMGYLQFANYIERKINVPLSSNKIIAEKELIKKHFSNRLVIIDEVHNCTKESKTLSKQLKKLAKYADNLRFVLLSATPMYNSHKEIIWITNLMNLNDARSAIKPEDVFNEDGSFIEGGENEGKDQDQGRNLLRRKLNGYISYVRGENPYTFPFRVYPFQDKTLVRYPSLQMKGNQPFEQLDILKEKLYLTQIGEKQKPAYDLIIKKSLETADGLYFSGGDPPDFNNMESFGYTKLQAPLQALIIVFPHVNFDNIVKEMDDGSQEYKKLFGKEGLKNNMKFNMSQTKSITGEPVFIKNNYNYKPGVPRIFREDVLPQYSSKISNICNCIRESAEKTVEIDGIETKVHGGIIIVYTQYIDGGIVPMALALEEMGFARYGSSPNATSLFEPGFIKNKIDANTMELQNKVPFENFKQAKYMILSGDKFFSQDNAEDIKYATSKENKYGENVRVILISRAASEGLDFKFVRQVHILDPWYNLNRIEQIIGRGVRNRSHCGLIFEERNVEIYLHASVDKEKETADLYVYRYAEKKAKIIGEVTRLLKTVSVDCVLNISQTNFSDKKMEEIGKKGEILIMSSTMDNLTNYKLGDKPFSEVCDYMKDCEHKCYPEDADDKFKDKKYSETYDKEYISINSKQIIEKIKNLYKTRDADTVYHYETIRNAVKNVSDEELYYALTKLMEETEVLLDKYGRQGRLLNSGLYYIFQPLEVTETNISLYESSIPVKTKNDSVQYRIQTLDKNIKTPIYEIRDGEKSSIPADKYAELITDIENKLRIVTQDIPNVLDEKNDNWYFNLNSLKKHKKIKKGEKPPIFIPVMTRLILHGFDKVLLTKYVTDHILDTMSHNDRLTLVKRVKEPRFTPITELETHIKNYFDLLTFTAIEITAVLLMKDKENENVLYNIEDWTELSLGTMNQFNKLIYSRLGVDVNNISNIVGFVSNFESKDGNSKPVFYIKNMDQKRNNSGSYLQQEKKVVIVKHINNILNTVGSQYSYDDENKENPERNTDDISQIAFSGIMELLIRLFNTNKATGKVWYLTPEQAVVNKIWSLRR